MVAAAMCKKLQQKSQTLNFLDFRRFNSLRLSFWIRSGLAHLPRPPQVTQGIKKTKYFSLWRSTCALRVSFFLKLGSCVDIASRNHGFSNRGSHFLNLGFLKYVMHCMSNMPTAGCQICNLRTAGCGIARKFN